ncbi:ribonuclease 3-like isoform X3 [Patiria miniata]|nr:ribonuclease 3-like isoform X3 [Patiria miniata]XP_038063617.1 ribonuclease 3-like isoform X3 [Patiria miniata]
MKEKHPARLADNLWFNDPGEVNDGPLCRCSTKARQVGIRHNIYPGEKPIPLCDPHTNNAGKLYHYRITMAPSTNFLTHQPTVIEYDDREYIFEGFSVFSHCKLDNIPPCKVVRFNIEYSIIFMEEPMPENFSVRGLDLFGDFLFFEILELYDFELVSRVGGCRFFHFMPRFARQLPSNGKEILSMHHVIQHLLRMSRPVVEAKDLKSWLECDQITWERYAEELKGMIVTCPGKKPSSVRVDQVDREHDQKPDDNEGLDDTYPTIVHFGLRPAQLSYAGNRNYQNLFKSYLKMNHLLANKPKVSIQDRQKLAEKEKKLQRIRLQGHMTREVTAEICSKEILMTGIGSDVCQHAMMLPVLVNHIRYFNCLYNIDDIIGYKFKDRILLKHAMTHPSYRLTYGMNPDHVRNSLYNCGIRQPDYGDKKKQVERSRKKGINTLIKIMSEMAAPEELSSHIHHYERLEFLGDAVVEFVTSTHLYYLFPHLEEGGLATYRQAIVQNQHLAVLAKKLELERFLLYAHGPDLCRSSDLKHALANCLEALMGALYLEGDITVVRRIFCNLLFDSEKLRRIWMQHPKHPLQLEFPQGDRHMIQYSSILQMLHKFEESTGIKFRHIRLLARAFTQRTMSYTNLTRGHNQRMEFLGDTVLQLITSSYLYKHFPNHHEGHLSLLRSSLVNNKTQATVASDLGMSTYIIDAKNRTLEDGGPLPTKLLADLLEAFVGAMYVDQGIEAVTVFCQVCFFPRLKDFIYSQHWNDAKSQLQQCCLTLRTEGKEPDVPQYKVISQHGPTNNRVYNVAVYFRDKRLGTGCASNTQDAQMEAARDALQNYNFPQLHHQRMVVERRYSQEAKDRGSRHRPRSNKI